MFLLKSVFHSALSLAVAYAASLNQVTNFGDNPGSTNMYIYVPDSLPTNPAVIVALHPCGGSGPEYFSLYDYHTPADQHGYILIYPSATRDSNCFDAYTAASLTHNGGSDSLSIVNMVKYAISTYGADASKIYVTGSSSGAIMTNVLVGAYPDIFAAGSAFSGMPYACLFGAGGASPGNTNQSCAQGQIKKSGAQWASFVHNGYPGYTGLYPRLQVWHGTADTLIVYALLGQEINEWTAVMGLSFTTNETNTPLPNYTKMIYGNGNQFQAFSAQGVGHFVPTDVDTVLDWFGITGTLPTSSTSISKTTSRTQLPTTSTTAISGCVVAEYGQCGGIGYAGCSTCAPSYTCEQLNDYYFQCL
ncbi:carbohydrate-binding module family 1 protein [Oidiodendron maius Zn]|uniref:Carboxylic ester hydrolase n=1 Tax=Oidiodendron maius (strain Zn) TaxID=913774 RepID=A0A0C3C590_OIDMZ|nr:carbohydrate-binding module family 1 protein [Oidiodendron maius Zn]